MYMYRESSRKNLFFRSLYGSVCACACVFVCAPLCVRISFSQALKLNFLGKSKLYHLSPKLTLVHDGFMGKTTTIVRAETTTAGKRIKYFLGTKLRKCQDLSLPSISSFWFFLLTSVFSLPLRIHTQTHNHICTCSFKLSLGTLPSSSLHKAKQN